MLIPWKVDVYMERYGYVNYGLVALLFVVFFLAPPASEAWMEWAGIQEAFDTSNMSMSYKLTTEEHSLLVLSVSSALLHADFIHLLGNCLFLFVFGNSVNCKIGHLPYAVLFLASAMVGSLAHYGFSGGPVVGASGAVYGVMGAFLVLYPRNDVCMFFLWFPFVLKQFRVSSYWMIGLWVAWNTFQMVNGTETNVALWGHLGGFLAGFGLMLAVVLAGWIEPTSDEQFLTELVGLKQRE